MADTVTDIVEPRILHGDARALDLSRHIQRCVDEYIFDVNGHGEWATGTEVYIVDQDVVPGSAAAAVMVRASDGARFEVFASVTIHRVGGQS